MPAMLPNPTLSFTIPSVQDDTVLQCRVYHPSCLAPTSVPQIVNWNKKAAIVAHPYAPLGGCYDDPVVDIVAGTILKQGWIVGTFNFRYIWLHMFKGFLLMFWCTEGREPRKGEHHGSRSPSRMTTSPL
jgi:hypothetical protein